LKLRGGRGSCRRRESFRCKGSRKSRAGSAALHQRPIVAKHPDTPQPLAAPSHRRRRTLNQDPGAARPVPYSEQVGTGRVAPGTASKPVGAACVHPFLTRHAGQRTASAVRARTLLAFGVDRVGRATAAHPQGHLQAGRVATDAATRPLQQASWIRPRVAHSRWGPPPAKPCRRSPVTSRLGIPSGWIGYLLPW
jgi:hypothetical protein